MATQGIAQNPFLTFVLGGARSGKSRHAQSLARATPAPWVMIATAEALDEEMRERIDEHKATRGDRLDHRGGADRSRRRDQRKRPPRRRW